MTGKRLDTVLAEELLAMKQEGRVKASERVITGYLPARDGKGPRYLLRGENREFLRMNSNSYLGLATHRQVIAAADEATSRFGVGPGAVRFIDGTFSHHVELEERIAAFTGKEAARIFTSAYAANLGLAASISSPKTLWVGDELNHNSIIRAMRIARVSSGLKRIYRHNSQEDFRRCLDSTPAEADRCVVITDGVFSMRGDVAPLDCLLAEIASRQSRFGEGCITVVDDSHGIGAFGRTGRGTPEYFGVIPDILVGTFGKAFGVNGGFVAASSTVVEALRQKADTYIYTNPLSVADCAAATAAIDICDSEEGLELLSGLHQRTRQFRQGLEQLGLESIPGPHPIVPLLVRDTKRTQALVRYLYDRGILAVGLTFPVVPAGSETVRFQLNSGHTVDDVALVLETLSGFNREQ
jgi:glycine C-acetyltransferase